MAIYDGIVFTVEDDGLYGYRPMRGSAKMDVVEILSKEAFVEAYNKWIKDDEKEERPIPKNEKITFGAIWKDIRDNQHIMILDRYPTALITFMTDDGTILDRGYSDFLEDFEFVAYSDYLIRASDRLLRMTKDARESKKEGN